MFKSDYFKAGYFKARYFRGKIFESILTLDAYFTTEVNWRSFAKRKEDQSLHISEAAVNNKKLDYSELFVATFSINSEETISSCEIYDLIEVEAIGSDEYVSLAKVHVLKNEDEEIIISLIMADIL
jgi:hypothetical protein